MPIAGERGWRRGAYHSIAPAAAAFAVLLSGAARAGDWTFYRHDLAGTGNAGEPLTIAQAQALEVRRYLMLGGDNLSNPIVVGGNLYYTSGDGYIHAIDLTTFTERWRKYVAVHAPFPQCVLDVGIDYMSPIGAPAVVGKTVFVPGGDGLVYALDSGKGTLIWSTAIADVHGIGDFLWSSIFPLNGKVYVGVASLHDCSLVPGRLVALDQITGKVTGTWWADAQHRGGGGIWTQQAYDPATNRIFATTGTIAEGMTTADQPWADAFVAIDPDTLQTIDWFSPVPNDTYVADMDFGASPTLYDAPDGRHFIAATDKNGIVYALDRDHLANGIVWSYEICGPGASPDIGESSIVSAPYADGMLYVAGGHTRDNKFPGAVAGLDAFTGAEKWLFHPDGFVLPGMTVTGDVLFVPMTNATTGRGKLYALDRVTGAVLYEFAAARMYGEPTWANGALYLGDGTGGMYELVPNPLGPQPDFDLEIDRLLAQGNAGSTMNFTATVIPKNGFAGSVSLSVTKIPSRATMALTPSVVGPSPAPYTSTVAIATSDFGAIYDLAVISATGGGRTRSAGMWLQIGDFALSGTAVQVPQGGSGTSTVRVAPNNGFDGPVTFTIGALPEGTTASFSPASATDHATLTFETSPSTPPGIYTVQVTGRSGTLTRTCTVALTVNQFADFKVELKEPSRQAPAGATAVYEVIVAASASFSGQITFSTNGLPPGATASFAPGAAPGVEVLTVTLAPDTASGPWTFSVVAAGGGLTRTVPAQLQVLPATGFDLTAPPSMRVAQGGAASFNVAITPHNGFADAVALAVDGLPAGVTASFSPLDSSGHSILTVSASTSATPGVHSASVKATGGGYTRTSPFSIEVVAASAGGGCTSGGSVGFAPALLSLLLAGRMRRRRSGRAAVG